MLKKLFISLMCIALNSIGNANATNIGSWSCTDDGMPICSYTKGDNIFQLIPMIEGNAIQVGVIIVGQCHQEATLKFSNGLQLKANEIAEYGPAKCDYAFNLKHHSMTVMSNAFLKSTEITFQAGEKTFRAPITQNDDLVHVLQYWKRQQEK